MVPLHRYYSLTCMYTYQSFFSFSSQTSELGVTEHVEGDPCKFALWVGRTPTSDNKIVLKVRVAKSRALHLCFSRAVRLMSIEFKRYWGSIDRIKKIC